MSIGTIVYPAITKTDEKKAVVQQTSPFDGRDVAIICLSGALVLMVIVLVVLLASR